VEGGGKELAREGRMKTRVERRAEKGRVGVIRVIKK
jgi:hypothetical protein